MIIPPITNQYLNLTKNSSLAVAVGYPDLVSISNTTLNQTGRAIECIALVMAVLPDAVAAHRRADELVQRAVGDPRAMSRRHGHCPSPARHRPPAAGGAPTACSAWLRAQPLRRLEEHARPRSSSWRCSSRWLPAFSTGPWSARSIAPGQRACRAIEPRGRLLGRHRREVPADPVRPLSVRGAVAAAARDAADGRDARRELHARALEPLAGRGVGRRAGGVLRADARRRRSA